MRFLGLILSSFAFFALLVPAAIILGLDDAKRTTMTLFYLSIPLTLLLSFVLSAAGRTEGLAASSGGSDWASRMQNLGFPIGHRHAWGDFGRLYALLFLILLGPVILAAFPTLIANNMVGFEQTVEITDDGTGLSETEAFQQIGSNQIALEAADQAKYEIVLLVARISQAIGLILIMPCFAKIIPFYFWRSGEREAPTLADTWRRVSWRLALVFGLSLLALLALCFVLPVPLIGRYAFATIGIAAWAYFYAKQVGPYDQG